jgi:hypothetical protein
MSLSISQILASSYEKVLGSKPENQWHESAAMRALESAGLITRINGAPTIEIPLDYQMNPDADFLVTDFDTVGLAKTEVITAASYTPAQLHVPVKWSKGDDAKNPSENQKIDLVASLLDNGFSSHDELIEQKLFAASAYNGFNSIPTLIPTGGQGTVGGIDASVETMWRNQATTYTSDFSDIDASMTTVYNAILKGSGSKMGPKLAIGSADAHAGFESGLVANQRYQDTMDANSGFKSLRFKGIPFVFSQQVSTTSDPVYFLGNGFKLVVFKNAYRQKGETIEIPNAEGYVMKIFSVLQAVVSNKSRLGVVYHA